MILIITIGDLIFEVQFDTLGELYLSTHMLWLQIAYETHEYKLV